MEKFYYIQNLGYVGNAMIWWGPGSKGYTSDIEDAGKYNTEEMLEIINSRPEEDFGWECDYIDNNPEIRKTIIESQRINMKRRITGKRIIITT